jgi:hypothetical protein
VNVAPWQPSAEAFDMLAAPLRVAVAEPFVPPLLAGTSTERPVWFVNDTPVGEHEACPESAVMSEFAPFSETLLTRTGKGLGLLILSVTSPLTPGYSVALVLADASNVDSASELPAFE